MIVDALEESLQTQQSDSSSVTMTLGSDGPIGRSEEASDARTGTDRTCVL